MKKHHSITEPRGLLDSTDAPHETVLHHMFQTSFIISFVYSFKLLQGSQLFESLPSHFSKQKNLGAFSKTCWSSVEQQSADRWPTNGQQSADRQPTGFFGSCSSQLRNHVPHIIIKIQNCEGSPKIALYRIQRTFTLH